MKDTRRRGRTFRTAASFALGATVGSLLALLYAPASGQATRRRIAMRLRTARRNAIRQLGQTKRVLRIQAQQVGQAARGWLTNHLPQANGNGRQVARRRAVRHAHAA